MTTRLESVRNPNVSVKSYVKQLAGSTFGDVERVCLNVLKECALDGRTRLQIQDIKMAVKSQELRQQVMQKSVVTESPRIATV